MKVKTATRNAVALLIAVVVGAISTGCVQLSAVMGTEEPNEWEAIENAPPLHRAAAIGDLPTIESLTRDSSDANATNLHGWTPLHMAAYMDQEKAIAILLARGAYVSATSGNWCTPLDIARKYENWNAVAILEKNGANKGSAHCRVASGKAVQKHKGFIAEIKKQQKKQKSSVKK